MGCTSSKKRTTSIDDLTAGDKKEAAVSSKKNGQLTSNDAKHKGDSVAIQIPGANKSFMAPDGIPFIDEDVDEDLETRGTVVVGNATNSKPDVNRNVVQAEVKSSVPPVVVAEQPSSEPAAAASKTEEDKKREIGAEILKREMEMTQTTSALTLTTTTTSETVHVEQVVVTTTSETQPVVNGLQPASEEEQERAAIKIQAGIRGYRDRQRVRALRASQQWQQPLHEGLTTTVTNGEHTVDGPTAESTDHDDMQVIAECDDSFAMEHTPEMDRAAVKIQASYKGYKTRKELHKI